eukprot:314332_1
MYIVRRIGFACDLSDKVLVVGLHPSLGAVRNRTYVRYLPLYLWSSLCFCFGRVCLRWGGKECYTQSMFDWGGEVWLMWMPLVHNVGWAGSDLGMGGQERTPGYGYDFSRT